ncbi:hypothetical protein ZWY2020_043002 [Hordeum vulgare]|nr:hypothetical protein ZWY2020_043002 [Hordeum vulgare]
MQRMSGIATMTKAMVDAARPACILETRKTAPGLRLVDKWAVLIGGGKNHRLGLFDMVIIKDNHVFVAGASGNVTIDTVKKIGETGVTYISRHEHTFIIPLTDSPLKFSFSLF